MNTKKIRMMTDQKLKQKEFHDFVVSLMTGKVTTYESVIGMVYTLIEDKHLISLNTLLKENYPEYYITTSE